MSLRLPVANRSIESGSGAEAAGAQTATIELAGIRKHYRQGLIETHAIRGISLRIEKGEFLAILGPSGSGKSTLLNVLGLLEPPCAGQYLLNGQDIAGLSDADATRLRAKTVGFVFQAFNLVESLSVVENVELPLLYRRMPASERRDRARVALDTVGLLARERHLPGRLSGGQQQRVALARALAGDPQLLLADEPTGNLDSLAAREVLQVLEQVNASGTTVVMVTHSPEYGRSAKRQVHLLDGQIDDALRH